jgi:prevent-host-death family protein
LSFCELSSSQKRFRKGIASIVFMTTTGHNEVMKTAKVSELKAKLSAYLAEARNGETVVVYDRNTPIARIVPFHEDEDDLVIIEASRSPAELKTLKGVRPKKSVDVDKLLRDLRQDR